MPDFYVTFASLGKAVVVNERTTLLDAAGMAGIAINGICGGDGICGRCKMIVKEGAVGGNVSQFLTREEIREGMVLACQTYARSNLVVDIPEETHARDKGVTGEDAQRFRAERLQAGKREFTKLPLVTKVALKLDPPTLDDNLADFERLEKALGKHIALQGTSMQAGLKITKRLPGILRDSNFAITATIGRRGNVCEIMDVEPGDTSARNYMAIADIGTSTIVVHLVNANSLSTVDTAACFNSQSTYGREVTARIIAAEKKGLDTLQELLVADLNRLIGEMAERNKVSLKDISAVVCAGNTTMIHFLLGLPVENIRRNPFIATSVEPAPFRAAEVGLKINPRGLLFSIPGISAWVGGDLTAGILATGLHEMDEVAMLIDIGTNGEIIVGCKDWLVACSASTGPALEGASVACGMMAERGAIERVVLDRNRLRYKVIGNVPPKGLCGSGIIDLIAVLLDRKVINRAGKFVEGSDPALTTVDGRQRFTLVEKGCSANGTIGIYQEDIDNVITAKAAVFAAANILLGRLDMTFSDVQKLFIAGGFGSYINLANATKIGLLPEMDLSRVQVVGNTSIWGARLAAFSAEAYDMLHAIREKTIYYDLLGSTDYLEQFRQAMFLPHTNLDLFPTLFVGASEEIREIPQWQKRSQSQAKVEPAKPPLPR